jgi:ribonuclease-3
MHPAVIADKKTLLIYNPLNKLLTNDDIVNVFQLVGMQYQVKTLKYFQTALTHISYMDISNNPEFEIDLSERDISPPLQRQHNDSIEFTGDKIVGAIIGVYISDRYPKKDAGFLTKLHARLVKTQMFAQFATYLGLGRMLLISKHVENLGGRENPRILEDAFEAFIRAIFLDVREDNPDRYGVASQVCWDLVTSVMENTVDFRELMLNDNHKETLQNYFQVNFNGKCPEYVTLKEEGPTNNRIFTIGIYHPERAGELLGKGVGKKTKNAAQIAAQMALEKLTS